MSATADPITITGGSVQVEVNISDARIRLTGDDFLVRTGTEAFVTTLGNSPFPSGTTLNLGGVWQEETAAGEATFNGVHYPLVYFGLPSNGTFLAPSVTLTGGEGYQTFTVPFTFNGVATAFASPDPAEQPLFSATLVGSGSARAAFSGFQGPFGLVFEPVTLKGADYHLEYSVFALGANTGAGNLAAPGYGRSRHGRSSTPQPGSKRPKRDDRENSSLTRLHGQTCGPPSAKELPCHQPLPSCRQCRVAPPRVRDRVGLNPSHEPAARQRARRSRHRPTFPLPQFQI